MGRRSISVVCLPVAITLSMPRKVSASSAAWVLSGIPGAPKGISVPSISKNTALIILRPPFPDDTMMPRFRQEKLRQTFRRSI